MSNFNDPRQKHHVLLLNFTEEDAEVLRKAGFNAELGFFGNQSKEVGNRSLPYYFPRPIYEYEVLVYNSNTLEAKTAAQIFPSIRDASTSTGMFEPLVEWNTLPAVRIAITGGINFENLVPAGLSFLQVTEAHSGVSMFELVKDIGPFSLPELSKTIAGCKSKMLRPVRQYASWNSAVRWPITHFPTIVNRNGDQIASYGTVFRNRPVPAYIVLPQLQNNAAAVAELLDVIAKIYPELFPDRETRGWYTSNEFAFAEEKRIDRAVESKIEGVQEFIKQMNAERVELNKQYGFIKKILVAREDPNTDADNLLSRNVRLVLEFLGFTVEDIDAQIRGAIRKEDFWVKDGDFIAITELTGVNSKNPKTKEYNDLLGRMTTIFKRRDLVPDASNITGLLIVNYDIDTHPRKRPKLYGGATEEIVESAKEQNISLLSTVVLYDIAIAVKDGVITKEQAREIVKKTGRIEFDGDKEAKGKAAETS